MKIKSQKILSIILVLTWVVICSLALIGCGNNSAIKYNINVSSDSNLEVYGSGAYLENELIYIFAVAKDGYEFSQWNDGSKENPRRIMVDKNKNYSAISVAKQDKNLSYGLDSVILRTSGQGSFQIYETLITNENSSEDDNYIVESSERGRAVTGEWICRIDQNPTFYGRCIRANTFTFNSNEKLHIFLKLKYSDKSDPSIVSVDRIITPSEVSSALNKESFILDAVLSIGGRRTELYLNFVKK